MENFPESVQAYKNRKAEWCDGLSLCSACMFKNFMGYEGLASTRRQVSLGDCHLHKLEFKSIRYKVNQINGNNHIDDYDVQGRSILSSK